MYLVEMVRYISVLHLPIFIIVSKLLTVCVCVCSLISMLRMPPSQSAAIIE